MFQCFKLAIFHNVGLKEVACIAVAPSNAHRDAYMYVTFLNTSQQYCDIYIVF